jgi:hypothetical protein
MAASDEIEEETKEEESDMGVLKSTIAPLQTIAEEPKYNLTGRMPKFHSESNHNFYMKKYKSCLYCKRGSIKVQDETCKRLLAEDTRRRKRE